VAGGRERGVLPQRERQQRSGGNRPRGGGRGDPGGPQTLPGRERPPWRRRPESGLR
jgi:hypothetical protein